MPSYTLGATPPHIKPDRGSGAWCSESQEASLLVFKRALQMAMDSRGLDITIGGDAVSHMRHYMNNTGNDYSLDMPAMLQKSAQLKRQYEAELAEAKAFAETLPPGKYDLSSSRLGHGYFRHTEDRNLYFAIGGYAYWGQAKLEVRKDGSTAQHHMDFEFHFYDRYNWDKGKSVTIAGIEITDEFMQRFHRQCYAREFDVKGTLKQQLDWHTDTKKNTAAPQTPSPNPFAILAK